MRTLLLALLSVLLAGFGLPAPLRAGAEVVHPPYQEPKAVFDFFFDFNEKISALASKCKSLSSCNAAFKAACT